MIGTGSVLRSEPASDVTPVTVLERQPHRIYHQLREVLRLRLGERHANLLAEPLAAERGLGVQWRAPLPGNARAHGELSEADQGRAAEMF
jgi:hypothetical protein